MLIFDIGANIGRYALANKEKNTIVSIEASPKTFETLVKNVGWISNIIPLHYAVSPSTEPLITFFHCSKADTLSTLNKDWLVSPESRFGSYGQNVIEYSVPVISLDKLIETYGKPDIVKVDVEGAEHIVLKSLTKKIPCLCFEWASEWKAQNIECIQYLVSLGFTQFHVQNEDAYTYRPTQYDFSSDDVISFFHSTIPKKDWGMVWAI